MGDEPDIGLAPGNRMIRQGSGDDADGIDALRYCILGTLLDIDDELSRPVFQLLGNLDADHL